MGWQVETVIANQVIIFGEDDAVFVYNGTPALNSLAVSITSTSYTGNDPYGNSVLSGVTLYQKSSFTGNYIAQNLAGLQTNYFTSPTEAGPWGHVTNASWEFDDANGVLAWLGAMTIGGSDVNPTVIETDSWHTVTSFGTGFAAGTWPPQYRLYPDNTWHLRGQVSITAAVAGGNTIFQLPSGPAIEAHFATGCTLTGYAAGDTTFGVSTSGTLFMGPTGGANGNDIFLDGVVIPLD
jgi:hypothetical protein